MDVSPRPPTPGVSAYPRSAVDEFLSSGELEARQLEQAIAQAHVRTERATFVSERAEAISEMLHSILQDLRCEFADRRLQVEAQAEGIVAAAQDEAARLLADARRNARGTLAAPAASSAYPRIDTPVPTPSYRWVASPSVTPDEPDTSPVPLAVGGANLGADDALSPASSLGARPVAPIATPPGSGVTPGNGAHAPSTATRYSEPAGDDQMTTIDLTADAQERPRAGLGRLWRGRRRGMPIDTGDDEFLDYLRGALVDDAPLHPEPDDDSPVDWRWTS